MPARDLATKRTVTNEDEDEDEDDWKEDRWMPVHWAECWATSAQWLTIQAIAADAPMTLLRSRTSSWCP
jgi:hypothetical protein